MYFLQINQKQCLILENDLLLFQKILLNIVFALFIIIFDLFFCTKIRIVLFSIILLYCQK